MYIIMMIKLRIGWMIHVACIEMRNAYRKLVVKPEGKISCERPRHR